MHRKKRDIIKPVSILTVIFLFFLLLDFIFFTYDSNQKNKETINEISIIVDDMISYANKTNDTVMNLMSTRNTCDDALPEIRRIITTTPFVRSISFGENGVIKCHSLIGNLNIKDPQKHYLDNRMALITGNLIQSQHPILLVKNNYGSMFYVTAIDGMYLQMIMKQLSDAGLSIQFSVGGVYVSGDGILSWRSMTDSHVAVQSIISHQYPYKLTTGLNYNSIVSAYLHVQKYHIYVLAFLFLTLTFVIIRRSRKPYTMSDDIRLGIEGNEFIAFGQKITRIEDGTTSGIEILVRWSHPTQGLVRPDIFIPQAEASGLIIPITQGLFKQVSTIINSIDGELPDGFYVSFNITAKHFDDLTLYKDCINFLSQVKNKGVRLILELTEREIIPQDKTTLRLFRLLHEAGIELAIDDFGTGHSSYSYLHNHYISILKIDRSFVDKINTDAVSSVLIDSVIHLGNKLSLKMIAEGVETKEQVEYLHSKNIKYAQGYLYGKPKAIKDIISDIIKS